MKNVKYMILVPICFVLTIIISAATAPKKDVKVFVSNESKIIKANIETWSKYGYKVDNIISQDVSISLTNNRAYSYNEIKGDIILIMSKN